MGRDRRTIAAALRSTPPEGKVSGGHDGWTLATALAALSDRSSRSPALEHFANRLVDWQEIHSKQPMTITIDEAAAMAGVDCETILVWLRAGMPYVTRGDFATGAGFELRPAWLLDVTAIAQEIVNRAGWASGNAMSFFGDDDHVDGNEVAWEDYSGNPSLVAELQIAFTAGS